MAKNSTPPSSRQAAAKVGSSKAAGGSGGRKAQAGRSRTNAPIKKPFPWGLVAGSLVVVLALGGIVAYAATHAGSGASSALKTADKKVAGVAVTSGQSRNHVATATYKNAATTPPDGGDHNAEWQDCQPYTAPIANEHAVHSLEHGAVWVTYDPAKVSGADLAVLTKDVTGNDYRMLSPYPGLKAPVSLQAWGRQLFVQSVNDPRVVTFLQTYTQGPQTPEQGAACSQGTNATVASPTSTS